MGQHKGQRRPVRDGVAKDFAQGGLGIRIALAPSGFGPFLHQVRGGFGGGQGALHQTIHP